MADALPIELIAHTIEEIIIKFMSFLKMIWGKEFLTGNYDILTRGWEMLPVAEGPYPWLNDLTRG